MAPAVTLNFYVSILLIWCQRFCCCVLYKISHTVKSKSSPVFFPSENCRRVWWTMPPPCSTSQTCSGWKRGRSNLISTLRVSMDSWQQGWEPLFFSLILFSDQCWNANALFRENSFPHEYIFRILQIQNFRTELFLRLKYFSCMLLR